MNDLDKALGDISTIRRQMAEGTEFRGYGPLTLAGTGLLAIAAGFVQALLLPSAQANIGAYIAIWVGTAALSACLIGAEMYARTQRIHSGLADEMIQMAVEQFLPAVGLGSLLTLTVAHFAREAVWMLPGLWQIIYALGIFACCRFLPRSMTFAALWFVVSGLFLIALGDGRALRPAGMAVGFGVGQVLIAAVVLLRGRGVRNG